MRTCWQKIDSVGQQDRTGTEDLTGFLDALQERRSYFLARGATASEHHSSDVATRRLSTSEAEALYRLARSAELLPQESLALQGHLLWETGRMAADDGMVLGLFPPAGFSSGSGTRSCRWPPSGPRSPPCRRPGSPTIPRTSVRSGWPPSEPRASPGASASWTT